MTKILATIAFVFSLFVGTVVAQEQFAPEVDVSSIATYSDYEDTYLAAYAKYEDRYLSAYEEYQDSYLAAYGEYQEFEYAALVELRTANFEKYLEWIDAEKIGDYERMLELEQVPEIAHFKQITSARHDEYIALKDQLHEAYTALKEHAHEVYETEKAMAYDAYLAAK